MLKNKIYFFALLPFLVACGTNYSLVKSNRVDYAINQQIAPDSNIIKLYAPYKAQLDAEMNKVIGYAEVALTKRSSLPESILGNFFADATLNQAKKIAPEIDFAMPTTKGGLRNDIAKGDITVSNVFELMPFENELVLFTLKGEDVLKLINYIAVSGGQPVAGIKLTISAKTPKNITINGKAFDINQSYKVLTSDYIASGGDDAQGFAAPIAKKVLGLKVRDALLNEVAEINANGKKVNAKLDGRITAD
jgi:2',3'-cyclic-nucleotide 2'-phosphodiesterase (5'-nucleotidase family)